MAVQRHIIVVEHMRSDAIDEGRSVDLAALAGRDQRCFGGTISAGELAVNQGNDGVARARDHYAEAIREPRLRHRLGLPRHGTQL